MIRFEAKNRQSRSATRSARSDRALVAEIRRREADLAHTSQQELKDRADELRGRRFQRQPGWLSDEVLIEACGLACVAARETLGHGLYDVQLLAGLARKMAAPASSWGWPQRP